MKKILVTLIGMTVGAAFVHAQGYLLLTSGTSFGITTNTGTFGNPSQVNQNAGYSVIVSGKTAFISGAYDYTYLFIPAGVGATSGDSNNLASSDWVQLDIDSGGNPGGAIALTNTVTGLPGNMAGQNAGTGAQAIGPTSQAFANGTTYAMALVGWSSTLGSSWSQVMSQYQNGWTSIGFFGYTIGAVNPNAAPTGANPTAIFGANSLTMYAVAPVPEPATIALAGLGGLSMLFLRRRKS